MGGDNARLFGFFLLLASASVTATTLVETGYCEFWNDALWQYSNPNIVSVMSAQYWDPKFSSTLDSLQLDGASPVSGDYLSNAAGIPSTGPDLSSISSHLDKGNTYLAKAKSDSSDAKVLASKFSSSIFSLNPGAAALLYGGSLVAMGVAGPMGSTVFLLVSLGSQGYDALGYLGQFSAAYKSSLTNSFAALSEYSSATNAANLVLQEKCDALAHAGAGSRNYSGAASSAMAECNSRASVLSSWETNSVNTGGDTAAGKFVRASADSQAMRDYLCSRPAAPDFSQTGFAEQANALAGRSVSSCYPFSCRSFTPLTTITKKTNFVRKTIHRYSPSDIRGTVS